MALLVTESRLVYEDAREGAAMDVAVAIPPKDLLLPETSEEVATKRRSSLRRRREDPAESVVKEVSLYFAGVYHNILLKI